VETNNPNAGQNAVLAYQRDPKSGALQEIGKFDTGGTGQINVPKLIGPDDSSDEVVASPDGRFLFAVNEGSSSVASFRILDNGALSLVGTFASNGVEPDSLTISGSYLYVSNRGDSVQGQPGSAVPNITVFAIGDDGSLSAVPNGTVTFPVDTSPSQALISKGRLLFEDIFGVPGSTATDGNTLAPFQIQAGGTLQAAPGGDVGAPVSPPLLLGSALNPHFNIIYSGLTGAGQIGVFTFDETGRLSFVRTVADQGTARAGRPSAPTAGSSTSATPAPTRSASSRLPIRCAPWRFRSSVWADRWRPPDHLPARSKPMSSRSPSIRAATRFMPSARTPAPTELSRRATSSTSSMWPPMAP
jgi:hypothetical protein